MLHGLSMESILSNQLYVAMRSQVMYRQGINFFFFVNSHLDPVAKAAAYKIGQVSSASVYSSSWKQCPILPSSRYYKRDVAAVGGICLLASVLALERVLTYANITARIESIVSKMLGFHSRLLIDPWI